MLPPLPRSTLFPYTTLFRSELADQPRILRLVAGERGEELARARFRDRADVRHDLVARHADAVVRDGDRAGCLVERSEEHTSELQSLRHLVCRLLLEKKKKNN